MLIVLPIGHGREGKATDRKMLVLRNMQSYILSTLRSIFVIWEISNVFAMEMDARIIANKLKSPAYSAT